MSKAARLYRESNERGVPSMERSWSLSPGSMLGAIVVGVGLLLVLSLLNWRLMRQNESNLSNRLAQIENRLEQLSTKVEQAGTRSAPTTRGPDPNRIHAVRLEGAPVRGPRDAPITIAEFSDFQCPFCQRVGPTLEQVRRVYGDTVRIVWKHYPLDFHKEAKPAALAAMAAFEQGRFWEYHDKLFANQQKMQQPFLMKYAEEVGLDMNRFKEAFDRASAKPAIEADLAEAKALGITGTPAFFVNGRYLSGAKPFQDFATLINAELTRLKLPIPAAAKSAN